MCGRYGFAENDPDVIKERFAIAESLSWLTLLPRYNVKPTQTMPVVTRHSPNHLVMMQWGLQPVWMQGGRPLINAQAETLSEKKTFRDLMPSQRCLIPAGWFYEWQQTADGKQPYYIGRKDTVGGWKTVE